MPSPRFRAWMFCWWARPIFRSSWGCPRLPVRPLSASARQDRGDRRETQRGRGDVLHPARDGPEFLHREGLQVLHHPLGSLGDGRDPERPVRDQALTTIVARIDREVDSAERLPRQSLGSIAKADAKRVWSSRITRNATFGRAGYGAPAPPGAAVAVYGMRQSPTGLNR